jgi:crossover junction endodeoxyribonuclease RuvC
MSKRQPSRPEAGVLRASQGSESRSVPSRRARNPPRRLHPVAMVKGGVGDGGGKSGSPGGRADGLAEVGDAVPASQAVVMGIDPGIAGGISFLSLGGEVVQVAPMPVLKGKGKTELDVTRLVGLIQSVLARHEIRLVAVERVHSMPKQGVSSTFSFGRHFGEILGTIKTLGLPLELPLPQAWKRAVLAGTPGDKLAAIQYATRRFPTASLLATPLSRKPSDGIADSLCLSEYARRLVLGTMPDGSDK